MARLKVNQKSITINKHMKGDTPFKRVISYKIKGDREYNHPQSTTPDYINESKDINDLFVNNGKIVGVDTRFTDLNKNALEISIKNIQNFIINYSGTMSYISVSTKISDLDTTYDKAIVSINKTLKEDGKVKLISKLKKDRLEFPAKR